MAKGYADTDAQCRRILEDVRRGIFSPVYLLMGDEPYYPDMVCNAVIDNALDESERDFNQTICYGADVSVEDVITAARRYPMFAERQLVVVKEAQNLRKIEDLAIYCEHPLESTVLVLCIHGDSVDRRKALYRTVQKIGTVVDSAAVRDYEMPKWIVSFYASRGLKIDPDAAALLAEYAGTDLSKIAIETDKMLRNLPEGVTSVTAGHREECGHQQAVQHIRAYEGAVIYECTEGAQGGRILCRLSEVCNADGCKCPVHSFLQDTEVPGTDNVRAPSFFCGQGQGAPRSQSLFL